MIEAKIYNFKEEFCVMLGIPQNQYNRRQDELIEWLKNFFEFDMLMGRPIRIHIKEVIGEYQPLPRKLPKQDELTKAKIEEYEKFTIAALGTEFKPNSKSRIAKTAMASFGYEKYGHSSQEAVARRFVKKPFDLYGETNNKSVWVWYNSYEPLPGDIAEHWRRILREENISEQEAANAFYRQEQGEDVSKEKGYYKKAKERFQEEYGDITVLVKEWKCKGVD